MESNKGEKKKENGGLLPSIVFGITCLGILTYFVICKNPKKLIYEKLGGEKFKTYYDVINKIDSIYDVKRDSLKNVYQIQIDSLNRDHQTKLKSLEENLKSMANI